MTDRPFEVERFGERLREVIADLGEPIAAQLTGKSVRQLKRYVAGDEPPFGVLRSLVEACGATLEWVTYGRPLSAKDHMLSIRVNERQIRELKNRIKATDNIDEVLKLKELMLLNQKLIDLDDKAIEAHEHAKRDGVYLWHDDKKTALELMVQLAGEAVDESYRKIGRRLSPRDVTIETARFVGLLMSDLKGDLQSNQIETAVRRVAEAFAEQLHRDAAAPESSKREAS